MESGPHHKAYWRKFLATGVVVAVFGMSGALAANYFAQTQVEIRPATIDVDLRPDQAGAQYSASTLKNIPITLAIVGAEFTSSTRAQVRMSGPGLQSGLRLTAGTDGRVEFPGQIVPGVYSVDAVELLNASGAIVATRSDALATPQITVLDEVLVTEVSSRPLSTEEIAEKGIVVDEDSFQVLNFAVGMQLDGEEVDVELPIALPHQGSNDSLNSGVGAPIVLDSSGFDELQIPNVQVTGFTLTTPPDDEGGDEDQGVPLTGLMIIPGDIAYLNQFFSVLLVATNVSNPESGITIDEAKAILRLPAGDDGILSGEGDDPLRIAETTPAQTLEKELTLQGSSSIGPGSSNQAEFLVEGLREGTHIVNFDISGTLRVPGAEAQELSGRARGVVQVRNPTFSLNMVHPNVVRADEPYRLYATVTNTSNAPANFFSLALDPRGLMGVRLADNETGRRTLETLQPGETYDFAFDLIATVNGEVRATVYLADSGINGSFLLRTGVGDTGIPLSPDTLILPSSVDSLPNNPDLVRAALRLLGQAYSNATAPAGSLPEGVDRIAEDLVLSMGSELGLQGLYKQFGESDLVTVIDIWLTYTGAELRGLKQTLATFTLQLEHLEELGGADGAGLDEMQRQRYGRLKAERRRVVRRIESHHAFDDLRQTTLAGAALDDVFRAYLAQGASELGTTDLLEILAQRSLSNNGLLTAIVIESDDAIKLSTAATGTGRTRLPFSQTMSLSVNEDQETKELTLIGGEQIADYRFTVSSDAPSAGRVDLTFSAHNQRCKATMSTFTIETEEVLEVVIPEYALCPEALIMTRLRRGAVAESIAIPVEPIVDTPPQALSARQWAKGAYPSEPMQFVEGDPHGRLVLVLLDKAVQEDSAPGLRVGSKPAGAAIIQEGERLLAFLLNGPLGMESLLESTLTDLVGRSGETRESQNLVVTLDPDRGPAAKVRGQVVDPRGAGIPFAYVDHYAGVFCQMCNYGEGELLDVKIGSYTADINGYYDIDYVLQNAYDGLPHIRVVAEDPLSGITGEAKSDVLYDGQSMRLDVLLRGYGDVAGRLVDQEGSPLVLDGTARVLVTHLQGGEVLEPVIFDNGTFAVRAQVGSILIRASGTAGGEHWSGVTSVLIPELDSEIDVDVGMMTRSSYGIISGRVLEEGGAVGAEDVVVQIRSEVFAGIGQDGPLYVKRVVGAATTDEAGLFRLEEVPTGPVEVYAYRQSTWEETRTNGVVVEDQDTPLTLVLPGSAGEIRGVVLDGNDDPVEGARVFAGPFEALTGIDGTFVISNLPRVDRLNVVTQDPASPAVASQLVDLSVANTVDVVLQFEAIGTLSGTVFEADGTTPVAGVPVQLWQTSESTGAPLGVLSMVTTDEEGGYTFSPVPARTYVIRSVRSPLNNGGEREAVLSADGQVINGIDIVYEGLGTVQGRVRQVMNDDGDITEIMSPVKLRARKWKIVTAESGSGIPNPYVAFVDALREVDGIDSDRVDEAYYSQTSRPSVTKFFIPGTETRDGSSNINIDTADQAGEYRFEHVLVGDVEVSAGNVFTTTASRQGALVHDGDVLELDLLVNPATGGIQGRVLMPDGETVLPKPEASLTYFGGTMTGQSQVLDGFYSVPRVVPEGAFRLEVSTGSVSCAENVSDCDLPTELHGTLRGQVVAGTELDVDIRLRGVGDVRVRVVNPDQTPVAGASLALVTSFPRDGEPQVALTDADGYATFRHVIEGAYTVTSRLVGTPRWASSAYSMVRNPAQNHLDDHILVLPTVDGTGSGDDSHVFGTISGTVLDEDANGVMSPVLEPTSIKLYTGSHVAMTLSDTADGSFRFENIPAGDFTLSARDEVFGRRAFGAGSITYGASDVNLDLTFIGLADVIGTVLSSEGVAVAGAFVSAQPSSATEQLRSTLADTDGNFVFNGLPVGEVQLRATGQQGVLHAEELAVLRDRGAIVRTDLQLEQGYLVSGSVLLENGQPAANALVRATMTNRPTRSVHTDGNGAFQFTTPFPPGSLSLSAELETRKASETLVLSDASAVTQSTTLNLSGQGSVVARLVDADDVPIVAAQARLTSGSLVRETVTDGDGNVRFDRIPAGQLELSFQSPNQLIDRASWQGILSSEGELVDAGDVALEPMVQIRGTLRSEEGSVVSGEILTLTSVSEEAVFRRSSQSDGSFQFDALPVGSYELSAQNGTSGCRLFEAISVTDVMGDIELGTLSLDCTSPELTTANPADYTTGFAPDGSLELVFSEPIEPSSLGSGLVLMRGATSVAVTHSVAGNTVVVEPTEVLAGFTDYRLTLFGIRQDTDPDPRASGFIRDLAGQPLAHDVVLRFTTGDGAPPVLVASTPPSGAVNIETSSVTLTFNEPVQKDTLSATVRSGTTVFTTTNSWNADGTQVTLTRGGDFNPNRFYTVEVAAGLRDVDGNPTTEILSTTFSSADRYLRTIADITTSGDLELGSEVTLGVALGAPYSGEGVIDTDDLARVEYRIGNRRLLVSETPPFNVSFNLTLEDLTNESRLPVTARAYDANQNERSRLEHIETVVDAPPTVEFGSIRPSSEFISTGYSDPKVYITATEDRCLKSIEFALTGAIVHQETHEFNPCVSASGGYTKSFDYPIPAGAPHGAIVLFSATATDSAGQRSEVSTVQRTIQDTLGPTIELVSPEQDTVVEPGSIVEAVFKISDESGISSTDLINILGFHNASVTQVDSSGYAQVSGRLYNNDDRDYSFNIRARDTHGNSSTYNLRVKTADYSPPLMRRVWIGGHPQSRSSTNHALPDSVFKLEFDEAVRLSTLFNRVSLVKIENDEPALFEWAPESLNDSDGFADEVFGQVKNLQRGGRYRFDIETGVEDEFGNATGEPSRSGLDFQVFGTPGGVAYPRYATTYSRTDPQQGLWVAFYESINEAGVADGGALLTSQGDAGESVSLQVTDRVVHGQEKLYRLDPVKPLLPNTHYTLSIDTEMLGYPGSIYRSLPEVVISTSTSGFSIVNDFDNVFPDNRIEGVVLPGYNVPLGLSLETGSSADGASRELLSATLNLKAVGLNGVQTYALALEAPELVLFNGETRNMYDLTITIPNAWRTSGSRRFEVSYTAELSDGTLLTSARDETVLFWVPGTSQPLTTLEAVRSEVCVSMPSDGNFEYLDGTWHVLASCGTTPLWEGYANLNGADTSTCPGTAMTPTIVSWGRKRHQLQVESSNSYGPYRSYRGDGGNYLAARARGTLNAARACVTSGLTSDYLCQNVTSQYAACSAGLDGCTCALEEQRAYYDRNEWTTTTHYEFPRESMGYPYTATWLLYPDPSQNTYCSLRTSISRTGDQMRLDVFNSISNSKCKPFSRAQLDELLLVEDSQ